MKLPVSVGVPEIVISLADHAAVTPGGKPSVIWAIPVAPVVAILIGVKEVFTVSVGVVEGVPAELVMGQPQVGVPVEDISRICPTMPGARPTHLVPFQYIKSPSLLPEGKSVTFNFATNLLLRFNKLVSVVFNFLNNSAFVG